MEFKRTNGGVILTANVRDGVDGRIRGRIGHRGRPRSGERRGRSRAGNGPGRARSGCPRGKTNTRAASLTSPDPGPMFSARVPEIRVRGVVLPERRVDRRPIARSRLHDPNEESPCRTTRARRSE